MDFSSKTKEELIEALTVMSRKLACYEELESTLPHVRRQEVAEEEPDHSRQLLSTILAASPTGISFSVGGKLRWANPAMVRMFGYESEDVWLGRKAGEFYSCEEEYQRVKRLAREELAAGRPIVLEACFKKFDGTTFPGVLRISHLDASDLQKGSVNSVTEITERLKAREALQESEERYRQLAENSLTGIYVHQDGLFAYVNERLAGILGCTPDEMIGKPFWEFVHPDDRELVKGRGMARAAGKPAPPHYEFRVITKSGESRSLEVMARTITYRGRLANMGNVADITERRRTEQALADEKERLAVTLRSIGDAVITTDVTGKVVSVNSTACALTGWSQEEAAGRPLPEVFHIVNEKTRVRCENPVERVLSTGEIVGLANDTLLIARDGKEFVIADSGAPIRDQGGTVMGVVLVFRDVTEQKRAADKLFRS